MAAAHAAHEGIDVVEVPSGRQRPRGLHRSRRGLGAREGPDGAILRREAGEQRAAHQAGSSGDEDRVATHGRRRGPEKMPENLAR